MMENDNLYICIEVYDDEIRYAGKVIWRRSPRYKTPEEVDEIIRKYLETKDAE